jgi:hypothetical protein
MGEVSGRVAVLPGRASLRAWAWRGAVFALLVGLWVMHGLSGTSDAGCHGAPMPMAGAAQMPVPSGLFGPGPQARPAAGGVNARAEMASASMDQMRHGELCLSGQPPNPGGLLLALLALIACALAAIELRGRPTARSPGSPRRSRHAPPGLIGRRLLTVMCVART